MTSVVRSRCGSAASLAIAGVVALAGITTTADSAAAQYFGRNKVNYESFDFRAMHTAHFDLYFYPAESLAVTDAGRMAERWYVRHSAALNDEFERRSLIFYADPPDFQQTNVSGGFIDQSTEGFTEPLRDRVVVRFNGVAADDDHLVGHEMVHVFQFDIANKLGAGGMAGFQRLPLWISEGMAEYLSIGREDANTAMWMRDAAVRNDLPTLRQLGRDPRYFPYRYGQAFWAYIGGRWGDGVIPVLFRAAVKTGMEPALQGVLGISADSLSAQWLEALRAQYLPLKPGRTLPDSTGTGFLEKVDEPGAMDVAPSVSPDGKYVAFFTSRALLNIELYVADVETGKIVKKLTTPNSNAHFDALSFINSSGAWSPDGKKFAFAVYADGDNEVAVYDVASGNTKRQLHFDGVGAINDLSWGPNNKLVFSGMHGGLSDIYTYDMASGALVQVTNDRYANLQPVWSPDGKSIAFATDSGPATDFGQMRFGKMNIAIRDMTTGATRLLPLFGDAKHINPQFSPDGKDLYFISDRGGINDIYRVDLATGATYQVTQVATGVSGIASLSPALSVAQQTGRLLFSVFHHGGYVLRRIDPQQTAGLALATALPDTTSLAATLPPNVPGGGLVTRRIQDPLTGLPPAQTYPTSAYRPSLSIDYIGSPGVGIGVASGPYGGIQAGGGVAAFFSDMLGNNVVGAAISGGGDIRNFGGQAVYQNLSHRLNWGVGLSHTPYLAGGVFYQDTSVSVPGGEVPAYIVNQVLQRVYYEQVSLLTQYPFSMTRRVELNAGFTREGFGGENRRFLVVGNQAFELPKEGIPNQPDPISYGQVSAALVGDYSYYGFTSPIAGGRYRFEAGPIFGGINLINVLGDYRRYFFARPITFAFRAVHVGRYGSGAERLYPMYVGDPQLVRGYEFGNINNSECVGGNSPTACPVFDRLLGSRIGVANFEIRVPLLGTSQLGLINFPYVATEIAPFVDAGVAWTSDQSPTIEFARHSTGRVPVFSAGLSARMNILGYLVLEAYYAYPFQRPDKGGHFGFQIAPGW
jgi:Periplasmic component of the Tol biopolymer transport system